LVAVGDQDELFEVNKVRDFYDTIVDNRKDFLVMKNTTHAKIPPESWQQVIDWLNKNF
jgi:esterase/lipase